MKRGRNQRRRPGGNPNRALDSNGPEVRIRGTANQIYDKYIALARDASSSGDRIKAESYLQHAEHYFRVIRATQPTQQAQQPQQSQQNSPDAAEGDQPPVENGKDRSDERGGDRHRGPARDESAAASDVEHKAEPKAEPQEPAAAAEAGAEEEAEPKPKRRRAKRTTKRAVKEDDEASSAEEPAAAAE